MRGSRSFFAIACCASALACSRAPASAPVDAGVTIASATSPSIAPSASIDATDPSAIDAGAAYATAAPLSGKSIGHTSVVFKLKLEGGVDVAYKPRSQVGGRRYRGEVAAYRLARALGIDNVPFADVRVFDYAALERAVGREPVFAQVVKDGDDGTSEASPRRGQHQTVRGALIPWIKGLEFSTVDHEGEMATWRAWLRSGGTIPDDQRALAAQISTMLAFDLVTGNWDRWSGGNVGLDRARNELLFIDNDGAFFDPVPVKEMKRGSDLFDGVDRFSRAFVGALRTVDLAAAMGEEIPGEPLLSARVLAQTDARRKAVLRAIDAKIARLGESAVLAFP